LKFESQVNGRLNRQHIYKPIQYLHPTHTELKVVPDREHIRRTSNNILRLPRTFSPAKRCTGDCKWIRVVSSDPHGIADPLHGCRFISPPMMGRQFVFTEVKEKKERKKTLNSADESLICVFSLDDGNIRQQKRTRHFDIGAIPRSQFKWVFIQVWHVKNVSIIKTTTANCKRLNFKSAIIYYDIDVILDISLD